MTHNIDATNQSLGRLASKIAVILRGKSSPSYQPHLMPEDKVVISNIKKIKFTGKKLDQKIYYHYSGYPGGMKERKLGTMFDKDPRRVLWLAVYRMLAKNRLRDKIMKNLEIES
ncbi:MAG: 50S ribosomal protein L13 [Candidatus Paceibacterota bacterium]